MELKDNRKKALEIIEQSNLDINLCNDGFFIVGSWKDLETLVQKFNGLDKPREYGDLRIDANGIALGFKHDDAKLQSPFLVPEGQVGIDDILGEWGFGDEHLSCSRCGNSIRTSPDSYSWKADYWINDGEIICGDEIRNTKELAEDYLEHLKNNSQHANTILSNSDMEKLGFTKCTCGDKECDFSAGLFGHTDDPKTILEKAKNKNPDNDYVFDIKEVGQFGLDFTIWKRPIEIEA